MGLREDIRNGAIASQVPLDEVLRRGLILAARLQFEPFKAWIRQELNGYSADDAIPPYRAINAQIYVNAVIPGWQARNQPVPPGTFPPELAERARRVSLRQRVAEIEGWASRGGVRLNIPDDVYHHLASSINGSVNSAWFDVSEETLRGILSTIRTSIVEFTLEIEEAYPNLDQGITEPERVVQEKIGQIFNVTILGSGHVVSLGGSTLVQTIQQQVNVGDLESLKEFLRDQGVAHEDLQALDEVVATAKPGDIDDDRSGLRRWVDNAAGTLSRGSKSLVQAAVKEAILLSVRYYFGEVTGGSTSPTSG